MRTVLRITAVVGILGFVSALYAYASAGRVPDTTLTINSMSVTNPCSLFPLGGQCPSCGSKPVYEGTMSGTLTGPVWLAGAPAGTTTLTITDCGVRMDPTGCNYASAEYCSAETVPLHFGPSLGYSVDGTGPLDTGYCNVTGTVNGEAAEKLTLSNPKNRHNPPYYPPTLKRIGGTGTLDMDFGAVVYGVSGRAYVFRDMTVSSINLSYSLGDIDPLTFASSIEQVCATTLGTKGAAVAPGDIVVTGSGTAHN